MGNLDRVDDRTFKANFTADGVGRLRETVMDKLKEFMGDYTDDTLVEYVVVLLRNGRRKDEAKNELNVFLGDDSDSFVSWLWDHLALNLDLYVQPKELQDEAPKRKLTSEVQVAGDVSQHLYSQSERGKSSKLSGRRHNRDWKELVRGGAEPPPLRSSEVDNTHLEEKTQPEVNHGPGSPSPPSFRRKRAQPDDQQMTKRDGVSKAILNAPRRLLQFAVRDAVATSGSSNLGIPVEPSLKRLRSVVSTPSGNSSLVKLPQRIQPISRVQNPMATAVNTLAEAAEDVTEIKRSTSVFDRLGRAVSPLDDSNQLEDNYRSQEQNQSPYLQRSAYSGQYAADMTMLEHETGFPFDSTSDNEGYDDVKIMGHRVTGASQIGFSGGNRSADSQMVKYTVAKNADDSIPLRWNRDQEQATAVAPNTSNKIVNISLNVNTWKPPQYKEPREVAEVGHKTFDNNTGAASSGLRLMKENTKHVKIRNGNENHAADIQKESQKTPLSTSGSSAAGRPLEDADSRTIFVSNVHFAATKDSLSCHFNKFGEVLKVVIVTDAATGQPKGSAYVEFMQKEAADNALSVDGTSFMSRILKVVRKSAAHLESAPTKACPRIVRGSPLPSARFSRVPFPRGIPGAFRPWHPIKPGARSWQWKRDAQGTPSDNGASLNTSSVAAPAARSLTYIRTESKAEGKQGAA